MAPLFGVMKVINKHYIHNALAGWCLASLVASHHLACMHAMLALLRGPKFYIFILKINPKK